MNIKKRKCGNWMLLDIQNDVNIDTDMVQLVVETRQLIAKGNSKVAIQFTPNSYLSTRAISPLLQCYLLMNGHGGMIALLCPNEDIVDTLQEIGLDQFIQTFDQLPN